MDIEQKVNKLTEFTDRAEWSDKRKMLVKKALVFYEDSRENLDRAQFKMQKATELIDAAIELCETVEIIADQ